MAVELARRRFTVDEYYRMAEAGILGEDDRVELIEGEIVQMSPIGPGHSSRVKRLAALFARRLGDVATIGIQDPIRLDHHNEPEPDVSVLRLRADYYAAGHPTPADVLLVVEVADSSLAYDQQIKAPLYGRHGIPEYWVVDVARGHLVVYQEPTSAGYATTRVVRAGETLTPLAFPDVTIAADEILG